MRRSTSPTTPRRVVAVLFGASALLGGCGAEGTVNHAGAASIATPGASEAPATDTFAPGQETLWPYYPHAHDQQLIDEARAVLLVQCGADHGWAIETPAVGKLQKRLAAQEEQQSVLYGITSRELVSKYGYSPSMALLAPAPAADEVQPSPLPVHSSVSEPVETAPGSTRQATEPSQQVSACIRQAQSTLFGGEEYVGTDPFSLGRELAIRAWLESRVDPLVQAVWQEWRTCMVQAGYEPPGDPVDPRLFPVRTNGAAAPPEEVSAALTDIDCKENVGLVTKWSSVVHRLENTALEKNRSALNEQRSHLEATLARARLVVTSAK